ncbi:MAG: 4-phosphopantetheinyl transferase family protein [Chitinophagaceae bacterium]|nr:4-phosphopantetheinyl transferase family protein [Chitinophagaceae bacterium]
MISYRSICCCNSIQESQVGVDIEGVGERIFRIRHKYLDDAEQDLLQKELNLSTLQEGGDAAKWLTRCWSAKESIYKWHGQLGIDFIKDISLTAIDQTAQELHFNFAPTNGGLKINYHSIEKLELTWIEN